MITVSDTWFDPQKNTWNARVQLDVNRGLETAGLELIVPKVKADLMRENRQIGLFRIGAEQVNDLRQGQRSSMGSTRGFR